MLNRSFYLSFLLVISIVGISQDKTFKKLIPAKPIGWVSDFEKNFTEAEIKFLDSMIAAHNTQTGNQIAIVTLSIDTNEIRSFDEMQQLSQRLFKKWGVGEKGKKNGIGILFSKKLRMIRIETGEGLLSQLTDAEAKYIIDNIIIPEFKRSNYFDGTLQGLSAILKQLQ